MVWRAVLSGKKAIDEYQVGSAQAVVFMWRRCEAQDVLGSIYTGELLFSVDVELV